MGLFKPSGLSDTPKEVFNYRLFWSVGVFGMSFYVISHTPAQQWSVSTE